MKPRPEPPALLNRLTTLGDMARLRILRLLAKQELTVGELARALQLPQSTVSRHLKLLHEGGWIIKRSQRTASLYCMVEDALDAETKSLWRVAQSQLESADGSMPVLAEDDSRLAEILAERREDSATFFGRLGAEWDHHRHELYGDQFTTEAMLALIDPSWVVADLGCGTGNAAEFLAPFVERIIAIDRESSMLDAARKRLEEFKNVEFRAGDLLDLPLDDEEIDAAMVYLVMHHLHEPAAAVREMARALKPGGIAMIVDMVAHDRESYRRTMGNKHLGFAENEVCAWADATGLRDVRYRRLHPDTRGSGPGLFVATMRR